jgi:thiol-disulfide isomerase/thioredoxin
MKAAAAFFKKRVWIFPGLALLALTVGQLCGTTCSSLRGDILGADLAVLGFVFYSGLLLICLLDKRVKGFFTMAAVLASAGVGTEIILVRFMVRNNTYCPKCLASGFFLLLFFLFVAGRLRKWVVALLVLSGAVFALFTFTGSVPLYAAQVRYPAFGNQNSTTEIILYSDYLCPVCRWAEPKVDGLLEKLKDRAKIELVDAPIHKSSPEYAEIFLYALFGAKEPPGLGEAIRVRDLLFEAGAAGKSPDEALLYLKSKGVALDEDKGLARTVFREFYNPLLARDSIHATPSLVVVADGKRKKYEGGKEIIAALKALAP